MAECELPGPRANVELVLAVADEGDELLFGRYLARDARKALGYCWSAAVVALPPESKERMKPCLVDEDANIRRVVREDLKSKRSAHLVAEWVVHWQAALAR